MRNITEIVRNIVRYRSNHIMMQKTDMHNFSCYIFYVERFITSTIDLNINIHVLNNFQTNLTLFNYNHLQQYKDNI